MRHTPGVLSRKFGEMLAELGVVDNDDVNRALVEQEKSGRSIDEILIDQKITTEQDLLEKVSSSIGISYVDVDKITIAPDVLKLIPVQLVVRYHVLPISIEDNIVKVATADPLDYTAFDDLRLVAKMEIEPVLAISADIRDAIKRYFGIGADTVDQLMRDSDRSDEDDAEVEDLTEDATIVRFVNQIIAEAIHDRATDIHIEPFEEELRIRYRIDGILYESPVPPSIRHYQSAVISRFKIMADMNIAEKRIPQDGRINFKSEGQEFDLRVSTVPTPFDESIVLRILNRGSSLIALEQLGFEGASLELFNRMIARPHGIVLVTGPTGSGKTTTLYAALDKLNSVERKIMTIEEPIEYQMHGITQIQVNPKIGLTFALVLRSLLRQDPDVMLVGETRDHETAENTIRAALTGHLVFTTLHTNDAAGAVPRLIDMGIEPFLVASSVIGMMAQRLVRKICSHCKEPYHPEKAELMALGLPVDKFKDTTLYRGKGCDQCKYMGYSGRSAIYEIAPMTDGLRELIVEKTSAAIIKKQAIANGMETMRLYGWRKALEGVTTIDEIMRVTQEDVFEDIKIEPGIDEKSGSAEEILIPEVIQD
jgi:type II secretion system protein E